MGPSEEMIKLLRDNCLTEIRKIEQELLQKLNATIRDDGIIDKLKQIFSRDRYAEVLIHHRRKQFFAGARYVDHSFNLFLFI